MLADEVGHHLASDHHADVPQEESSEQHNETHDGELID